MKRTDYLLIFLYTVLILAVIIHSIFGLFDFQWTYLLEDLSKLRAFLFIGFGLTVALTILMILFSGAMCLYDTTIPFLLCLLVSYILFRNKIIQKTSG